MPRSLRLKLDGFVTIQTALTAASKELGAPTTLALADAEGVFLECQAGPFDALHPDQGRIVGRDDVMWFASTTKLLTSICYLQLVDQGKLTLDTDMRKAFPPLDAAGAQIIKGFEEDGKPITEKNDAPITLLEMLNQTSGFGMEFGEVVPKWKAAKGTGFVNSCKVENLINTPLCFAPGTSWEYGNSAEWLGLMLPIFAGMQTEEYFQKHLLQPLGMHNTSFYPDQPEWKDRLVPLRFKTDQGFEELKDQIPLLTLPRNRAEIEYTAGGGGIYSTSSDYILVLQHLLQHRLSLAGRGARPKTTLLSDKALNSLFTGTLSEPLTEHIVKMFGFTMGIELQLGEGNWTTGMGMYCPKDGRQRLGWGRHAGTVGWGGAAGTEYWIDEDSGIAAVFTTQLLPATGPPTRAFKDAMEKAIYSALE